MAQRFKIRATINGEGVWVCPDCGHHQRLHLAPKSRWRIRCTHADCRSVFKVGLVFHRQGRGQGRTERPPDTILGESIAESRLSPVPYRKGRPVHRVEEETPGLTRAN